MKVLTMKSALFACLLTTLFFCSSCEEKGCTDPNSANYNPDATEDDGSCTTYSREKFFGEYLGEFDCASVLLSPTLDNDSLMFTVKEPVSEENINGIIFSLTIDGIPVDLEGTIDADGRRLTIDDTFENFTIPDFPFEGSSIVANVTGVGFADISDDEQSLVGELSLDIVSVDGATSVMDVCSLDGKKL